MMQTAVRSTTWMLAALLCGATIAVRGAADDRKPSLSLKVSPQLAVAPVTIRVSAELKGGSDEDPDLYCPQIEWEWGDDTTSASAADCAPFEAGRTELQRRFRAQHTYRHGGIYKITLRLKQKDRIVVMTSTNFRGQGGIDEQ